MTRPNVRHKRPRLEKDDAKCLAALIELHRLLNLLHISDGTVLDELLAGLGYRLVPLEDAGQPDAVVLADTAGLAATMASAMADGRIDHRERCAIVREARPLVKTLAAEIARHDRAQVA